MMTLNATLVSVYLITLSMVLQLLIFALLERVRPVQAIKLNKKELWNDLGYAYIGSLVYPYINLFCTSFWALALAYLVPQQAFANEISGLSFAAQLLFALVILDMVVYVRHRFMHEALWPVHAIHHSPDEVNWLTKYRLHPLEIFVAMLLKTLVLHIVGFDGEIMVYASTIFMGMDLLNHLNLKLRLPAPLCYLISCPDYHKWHHAAEKDAVNKNYVVMFPFIDIIFGTYYYPNGKLPQAVGLLPNASGQQSFPTTLWAQMLYPFKMARLRNSTN